VAATEVVTRAQASAAATKEVVTRAQASAVGTKEVVEMTVTEVVTREGTATDQAAKAVSLGVVAPRRSCCRRPATCSEAAILAETLAATATTKCDGNLLRMTLRRLCLCEKAFHWDMWSQPTHIARPVVQMLSS
jgi:hypothetical protein